MRKHAEANGRCLDIRQTPVTSTVLFFSFYIFIEAWELMPEGTCYSARSPMSAEHPSGGFNVIGKIAFPLALCTPVITCNFAILLRNFSE